MQWCKIFIWIKYWIKLAKTTYIMKHFVAQSFLRESFDVYSPNNCVCKTKKNHSMSSIILIGIYFLRAKKDISSTQKISSSSCLFFVSLPFLRYCLIFRNKKRMFTILFCWSDIRWLSLFQSSILFSCSTLIDGTK